MLKHKDLLIMQVIERVSLATARQIAILAGYRDVSVVRKRLLTLSDIGIIKIEVVGKANVYALTGAGLAELDIKHKPCEIKGFSTEHTLLVTQAACFMYIHFGRSVLSMMFDQDLGGLSHKPDIKIGKTFIEVELTQKVKNRYEENYRNNALNSSMQIWIIPRRYSSLRHNITELSNSLDCMTKVISVETMNNYVYSYDLHNNSNKNT